MGIQANQQDLSGQNFSGETISGEGGVLRNRDYSSSNLSGTTCTAEEVLNVNFSNTDLSGADFTAVKRYSGCKWDGAQVERAQGLPEEVMRLAALA